MPKNHKSAETHQIISAHGVATTSPCRCSRGSNRFRSANQCFVTWQLGWHSVHETNQAHSYHNKTKHSSDLACQDSLHTCEPQAEAHPGWLHTCTNDATYTQTKDSALHAPAHTSNDDVHRIKQAHLMLDMLLHLVMLLPLVLLMLLMLLMLLILDLMLLSCCCRCVDCAEQASHLQQRRK